MKNSVIEVDEKNTEGMTDTKIDSSPNIVQAEERSPKIPTESDIQRKALDLRLLTLDKLETALVHNSNIEYSLTLTKIYNNLG